MRKLRRFCASLSLAIALSSPTIAGNIHLGYAPPPPPPDSSPLVYEPTGEDTSLTTGPSDVIDAASVDPLAELALALLNGMMSIF